MSFLTLFVAEVEPSESLSLSVAPVVGFVVVPAAAAIALVAVVLTPTEN